MPRYVVNLPFAIFAADTEGRVQYRLPLVTYTNLFTRTVETVWLSPQVERLTGYTPAEWIETAGFFASILHEDDRDAVLEDVWRSRTELQPFSRDYRLITRSGEIIWVHDESVPVLDKNGRPEFIQGYFIDLTERKALEQQLLHAQKTEALGRMAAGIAHDFNNYLTAIAGYAEMLCPDLQAASKADGDLIGIIQTTARAKRLVEQLLTFCRHEPINPRPTKFRDVVNELESMLTQIAGPSVSLELELSNTPVVYIDLGQLEQVIVNLVANARDAMPTGGTVKIGTSLHTVVGHESTRLGIDPGSYVVLTVSDTGVGIDPDTIDSIFDPFFTTKKRDEGTGLGLSNVLATVSKNGGAIDVASTLGRGTSFRVLLPAIAHART